ncbi:MAG TPA: flagellar basal body rod protein FlgF [Burkholderiales bacterium]|nr:flagellar basal body rod protein FlgF [Burkholderiales bacterium]
MDKLVYTAMSGAKYLLARQDTAAQNLAHVSTNGYRAQVDAMRSSPLPGDGASTRVLATDVTIGTNFAPGPVQRTGNPLDVAVSGRGWIAVQALDGSEAYTRFGALEVSVDGALQTKTGLAVLSDGGGPINVPTDASVSIAEDGTVSGMSTTGKPTASTLGRIKLANPEDTELVRGADGLFRTRDGEPAAADAAVRLQPQALEGSNVNAVEAMVTMITVARQFEMQMKMITAADENARQADKLLAQTG